LSSRGLNRSRPFMAPAKHTGYMSWKI
jgi:hypothetical protein